MIALSWMLYDIAYRNRSGSGCSSQLRPIGYDDLESYNDKFEKVCGTWGKAGKLQGKKIDGGNVFEAPVRASFRIRR